MDRTPTKVLEEIKLVWEDFVREADKHIEKENASAGRRSRTTSIELAKLMKEWRSLTVKR